MAVRYGAAGFFLGFFESLITFKEALAKALGDFPVRKRVFERSVVSTGYTRSKA